METTINQRIEAIISHNLLNVTSFAKFISATQPSIRDIVNGKTEPRFTTLRKILLSFPVISADWLILGTGSMLRDNKPTTTNFIQQKSTTGNNTASIGTTELATIQAENKRLREDNERLRERCDKLTDKLLAL